MLVIGAGQSGLGVAARLKTLGVPTLVVEKQKRVGDQWRGRYQALCLHDPVCKYARARWVLCAGMNAERIRFLC